MILCYSVERQFKRLQQWYYTPSAQATILGLVFLLVFAAYLTIQAFAARTYGDVLASNTTVALYAVFTVACLISPKIILFLGPRKCLLIGIFGYVVLVVASLGYFLKLVGPTLVIVAGGINGMGSALLWTAQGVLILQYSDRGTNNGGTLFSIFWAFFNVSAIVGGLVSFCCFGNQKTNHGLTTLYIIFLGFILAGAILSRLLLSPSVLVNSEGKEEDTVSNEFSLLMSKAKENAAGCSLEDSIKAQDESLSSFSKRTMVALSLLFFYTGFKQPYQLVTFGDRYFDDATLSLEVVLFYLCNMMGGIFAGRLLDGAYATNYDHRSVSIHCIIIFVVITILGNAGAVYQEWSCRHATDDALCAVALDYRQGDVWIPTLAFLCWGITDALVQTYCYWLMGLLCNKDSKAQSKAIGFYVCVQSLGWCLGFLILPASRVKPMTQLSWTIWNFVLGTATALTELPRRNDLECVENREP